MEYKDFAQLIHYVSAAEKRCVAVAAAHDEHTLDAVLLAAKEGFVNYTLVGNREQIMRISETLGYTINQSDVIDAYDDTEAAETAVHLIRDEKADFLMKGNMETATLMRAALNHEHGIRTSGTMSHIAFQQIPMYHKLLAITDGGMLPHPTLKQKTYIVHNVIAFFHALGYETPKVAVLAASESVNDRMPETTDAKRIKEIADEGVFGACIVDGPLSFDLALSRESAGLKEIFSPVTGDVDILVVPDITCGNTLGKCLMYMAGAKMAGCIVGAKAPIVLTSRGASVEEKHLSLMLSAASVGKNVQSDVSGGVEFAL